MMIIIKSKELNLKCNGITTVGLLGCNKFIKLLQSIATLESNEVKRMFK